MTTAKTLIVGFGNALLGDDGFGVEVVQRLAASTLPPLGMGLTVAVDSAVKRAVEHIRELVRSDGVRTEGVRLA